MYIAAWYQSELRGGRGSVGGVFVACGTIRGILIPSRANTGSS